ncbi:hypothetical protein SAMN06298212_11030 [Ruaniaceae bacterium KH17]|nr:hypothetical protein SAMN06298212_11030 [Ruaniaceae bacterium KH17]
MARTSLPSSVSAHLGRTKPEVVAPLVRSEWLVVSADRLIAVGEEGIRIDLPWIAIENASWDGSARRLTVNLVDGQTAELHTKDDDVWLATTAVREHVNSSIVHVEYLDTLAGGEVRALIRKDSRGNLSSQLIARGPVAETEQPEVDALERRARAAVGLPTP